MATIDGGSLSFTSELNNDQLKQAVSETIARVKGLSDASVQGGKEMADAFAKAAQDVRAQIDEVSDACQQHERVINDLKSKYNELGAQAGNAFMAGRDAEGRAIQEQQRAVRGEIRVRQQLLSEARELSNALEIGARELEDNAQAANDNANAHQSMRARIRELKEELVEMEMAGQRNTDAYRQVQQEVAKLTDAWADASQQASYMANDQAGFKGIMSGLTGMTGGFQAVSSAVSLFAGENENLQAAMLKVQQMMSITQGLQAVSEALNKDSYFSLVTLGQAKEWWNNLLAVGRGEQIADTAAKSANTVATEAQTAAQAANTASSTTNTAAKSASTAANVGNTAAVGANAAAQAAQTASAVTGTAANIGLAGAFRMVGAAIKSIPVFGWVAAGISAIVAVTAHFVSKTREAKKASEEFANSIAEGAYKPIGSVMQLSTEWDALGNNMDAKRKFIEDNKESFENLGVSINGVTDAENLLNANKEAFINAQIEKAKAAIYMEQAADKVKELIAAEQELAAMPPKVMQWVQTSSQGTGYYVEVQNTNIDTAKKKITELRDEITNGYTQAAQAETNGANLLTRAGIQGAQTYEAGTLGAIEQAIAAKREALKLLTNNDQYKAALAEILELQKQASAITGEPVPGSKPKKPKKPKSPGAKKDPFMENLESMKKAYSNFEKWMNSGDDILVNSAKNEFANILKQGSTYIEYLKNQRDTIMSIDVAGRTKEQNRQLRELNNAIAEETRSSVLEAFNEELNTQLSNARTIIDQLNIIEQRRKELANDGTQLDADKSSALNDAEDKVKEKAKQETDMLLENYAGYIERKKKMEQAFNNDIATLNRARMSAQTDDERAAIDDAIANRTAKYQQDNKSSGDTEYDKLLEQYKTYEERRAAVSAEYDEKITKARLHGNEELAKQLQGEKSKDLLGISFDELKASPEYAEAFTDLENVSTETLRSLVARFEECKVAIGDALNPEDLQAYGEKLNGIIAELNERDPFTTLKQGYAELRVAHTELRQAKRDLDRIQKAGIGGKAEEEAIKRVNKAKDKYIKKNNQVKKSEKAVRESVKNLCNGIKDLGGVIGGEAGEILNLIGDIGSFTLAAMDGIQQASKVSSDAIKAVESASVILAIISAALQIAQKIMSLFSDDDGTQAYEKASRVYENYVGILDEVIEKQKELIASMSDENARNSYNYAIKLLKDEAAAARELGKQYLNTGASRGFLGIGSKSSNGLAQRDEIGAAAWGQWYAFAEKYGIAVDKAAGRMTGLFDLTNKELAKLKEEAPLFYGSLADETQSYMNKIIETIETEKELKEQLNESFTGVDYDSFESEFTDMLTDAEMKTKDFTNAFQEYMRKALIMQMFKSEFKSQLQAYYDMWANALNPDGDGGSSITTSEQTALDSLRNSIINGAKAAADRVNAQFRLDDVDDSLTGAVAGVSEETASLLGGQMNAIRINQLENADIMRSSLLQLNAIAANTEYCRQLAKIDRIVTLLEGSTNSTLRSQGLQ